MSSFGGQRPGQEELIAFAQKANEIEIGGISELPDDMGMSLLANTNKINISTKRENDAGNTITLDGGNGGGGARFSENLEFVNLDTMETVTNNPSGQNSEMPNFSASNNEPFRSPQPMSFDVNKGSVTVPVSAESQMSPEQIDKEKNSLLTRMQRMSAKGMGGQRMTMANSLEEIKAEYGRVVDTRNLEASIKFQRNALMTFATGAEFLNKRFDPFDINLDGWSESVHENADDYDEIFEELYDKYKDSGKMPPEVRLVMTLGVSAAMFHVTNTYFKSKMPGMDDILRNNPELMRQFASAAASQVSPGFGNFVGSAMSAGPAARQAQQQQQQQMPFNSSSRMQQQSGRAPQPQQQQQQQQQQPQQQRREMRGPTGVDDILQAFESERLNQQQPPPPPIDSNVAPIFPTGDGDGPTTMNMDILREGVGSETDPLREVSNILDEMQSVTSLGTNNEEGRKRRGRKPATVPPGGTLTLNF